MKQAIAKEKTAAKCWRSKFETGKSLAAKMMINYYIDPAAGVAGGGAGEEAYQAGVSKRI